MPKVDRLEHMEGVPESLWARLRAQPDRAPELIALAAADRFAPQAERWVRASGPGLSPEELGRMAVKQHVRLARLEGAVLGIGGVWTAAPDLVALAWLQSRMVFYVAASFGFEPKHPMRPAELLAIQGVYPTAVDAREALDGVGKRLAYALVEKSLDRRSNAAIVRRLARYAGRQVAERYAGRLVPLIGAPIGAVYNGAVTGDVGRRALAYYGGH